MILLLLEQLNARTAHNSTATMDACSYSRVQSRSHSVIPPLLGLPVLNSASRVLLCSCHCLHVHEYIVPQCRLWLICLCLSPTLIHCGTISGHNHSLGCCSGALLSLACCCPNLSIVRLVHNAWRILIIRTPPF